jgi:hypothetical protein
VFRRPERGTLDDVVEYLRGIANILTEIDAKLDKALRRNGDDGDEEAGS